MKTLKENILNYVLKGSLVLLFLLTFIGFLNPAKISKHISSDSSLLKTAFYFKGFSSGFVDAYYAQFKDNGDYVSSIEKDENDDSSLENFYSQLANMMNEKSVASELNDSVGSADGEDSAYADYDTKWQTFKTANPDIAEVVEFDRKSCILTFMAIILCFIGMYMSCGTGIFKKIGFIVICVGSVFVALSLINYHTAYTRLSFIYQTSFDLKVVKPYSTVVFLIFALIAFCSSLLSLIFLTKESKEKDVANIGGGGGVSNFAVTPFFVTYRVVSLVLFIFLFLPAVNPARIMENISRNVSLFTSGFSYGTYTKNIERALLRGWLPRSVINLSFISSMAACIGIIACGIASCVSVGNNKLKRYAHIVLLAGSGITVLSMLGIVKAYNLVCTNPNAEKLNPVSPSGYVFFVVLAGIVFVSAFIAFVKTPSPLKDEKPHIDAPLQLFLMLLPFLILVFIFSYLPLWGWRYAFFDYSAGDVLSMENWVGFKWFKAPFENPATRADVIRVLKNTLAMSGLGLLTSWCPMFFAVFLSEIRNSKVKRVVQTLTTIPNFISWVLVYAIAFCIFGTEGFISSLFVNRGIWDSGKNMLMGDHFIWLKMLLWGMWKSLGWSAIMYIAAISGIDQELYEAATVDGASRIQKMIHITLPELIPTFIVLLILSVSNILSNGMDQYLVFKNSTNKGPIEVLDLYVYQLTFGSGQSSSIPFSTVVSMFKSLVSVILLFITNKISKWIRGSSIF